MKTLIQSTVSCLQRASFRAWSLVAVLMAATSMSIVVLYFQHGLGLEPCPLCVLQRLCVIGMALVALLAFIHNPSGWGRRIYLGLAAIPVIIGITIAGRHAWLQNLPPERVPECGPGYDFIMEAFPFLDALKIIFHGSGECAEIDWQFLGLTIPGMSLLFFSGILLVLIWLFIKPPQASRGLFND
jgi:disulfide bond formation protein DsbB